ncbi:MAG: YraN family protein [Thermoguttaceae bacterium]|nr:YraN family protein [Thermoguttaceae bacterium]
MKKLFWSFFVRGYRKIKCAIRRKFTSLRRFYALRKDEYLHSIRTFIHPPLGQRGERAAERFLKKQHWTVLARNFAAAHGEIDLVMKDGRTVVFVEVKTRKQAHFLQGKYSRFDLKKQRHIYYTSQTFLKRFRLRGVSCRYDLVTILWPDTRKKPVIHHYRNAFLFEKLFPK